MMRPGEALARRRVTLGFAFGAVALWLAQPTSRTLLVGLVVAAFGEAVRLWAAGHLNKAREVTTSVPYRWVAHPLYFGSALIGAGLAVASNSFVVAVLVAVYLTTTIAAAIRTEEAFLRRTFGDEYQRYRSGGDSPPRARFSVTRVVDNREYRAVAGLVLVALLLAWKATYNGSFWRAGG
jgi:Phospholipid methyltransferase